MRRVEALSHLASVATALSDDAVIVLVHIADRLRKGQEAYGTMHIGTDGRDYTQEAFEEVLDRAVYDAMEYERLRRWRSRA